MNYKCPHCKSDSPKKTIAYDNNNIDNVGHFRLECLQCGCNFNHWECSVDKIKEMFGKEFEKYL